MTKEVLDTHPVYCSCCPGNPQVVAMKLGDELLEIRSRKHGSEHVAVVLLDKQRDKALDSKE